LAPKVEKAGRLAQPGGSPMRVNYAKVPPGYVTQVAKKTPLIACLLS